MFGSKKKDAAFFDAFSRHATKSVEAARMLVELIKLLGVGNGAAKHAYRTPEDDKPSAQVAEQAKQLYARIKEAETAADSITHDTIKRLHENWITPFDRDDIHNLISRMDDVLDLIEAAAERVILFDVTVAPPEATELAELLVEILRGSGEGGRSAQHDGAGPGDSGALCRGEPARECGRQRPSARDGRPLQGRQRPAQGHEMA